MIKAYFELKHDAGKLVFKLPSTKFDYGQIFNKIKWKYFKFWNEEGKTKLCNKNRLQVSIENYWGVLNPGKGAGQETVKENRDIEVYNDKGKKQGQNV